MDGINFNARLELAVAEKGLSWGEVAALCGMSVSNLSHIRAKNNPHLKTINRIARALEMPVRFFFDNRM